MIEEDTGLRLGCLAVRYGMITQRELQQALATQAREAVHSRPPRRLGIILLSAGLISEHDLGVLLRHQQATV